MEGFAEKRVKGEKYTRKILPKPKKKLDTDVINSRFWKQKWSGGNKFQAEHIYNGNYEKFTIDLDIGSCRCRLRELSGLPCRHACAAIFYKELDPSDFISNY